MPLRSRLQCLTHFVGLLHGAAGHDVADFRCAGARDDAFFFCSSQAGSKSPQAFNGPLQRRLAADRRGYDEKEFLVGNFRIPRNRSIDHRLQLSAHRGHLL